MTNVAEVNLPEGEADLLRERWTRLGLPGLIDLHTHFMPKPVMDKVWKYFDAVGPLTGRPWPIAYRDDEEARLRTLRDFGVRAFPSLVYPHKPDMAAWLNAWARDFAARTPGCLHTATFFPEPSAATYVPEAIAAGARIFKAHVQVGAYDPGDRLLDPVWAVLEDAQVPVVLHAGSGPAPGRFTGPERVARLLARHPRLVLVIAHLGLPEYAEFLDLARDHERVHLDTTMVFTRFTEQDHPFPKGRLGRLVELADRIVFGSDFPNIPYPYVEAVNAVADLGLGDDWLRGVLHDNAARLLSMKV